MISSQRYSFSRPHIRTIQKSGTNPHDTLCFNRVRRRPDTGRRARSRKDTGRRAAPSRAVRCAYPTKAPRAIPRYPLPAVRVPTPGATAKNRRPGGAGGRYFLSFARHPAADRQIPAFFHVAAFRRPYSEIISFPACYSSRTQRMPTLVNAPLASVRGRVAMVGLGAARVWLYIQT